MTKDNSIQTHAYGSCMLMGEHSVLFNQLAVVMSLKQRIKVRLLPGQDNSIKINSSFGEYQTSLNSLVEDTKPNRIAFVITTLQRFKQQYLNSSSPNSTQGFELTIHSDIDTEKGFGSSAAVVVAVAKSLFHWQNLTISEQQLWQFCHQVVKTVQGRGSGADVCASIYSGVCVYSQQQGFIKHLDMKWLKKLGYYCQLIYCGYKTPTTQLLKYIAQLHDAKKCQQIYTNMGKQTLKFIHASEQGGSQNLDELLHSINYYHKLMVELGVSDATIERIVQYSMAKTRYIKAAKISGSGLGDCILVLSNTHSCPTVHGHESFTIPMG